MRGRRLAALTHLLTREPGRLFQLAELAEPLGNARSTVSEDISLIAEALTEQGLGEIETVTGAAGGVRFRPYVSQQRAWAWIDELLVEAASPSRVLPGGFLYMTDLVFSPMWAERFGSIVATRFRDSHPNIVVTLETKGIPLAVMTGAAFGCAVAVARRDARVTEGPALHLHYVSGSSHRISTMSLPRRAIRPADRVLLVDDFLKAGGTARGLWDLVGEFGAEVVGLAVLMESARPADKLVHDYFSLLTLTDVEEEGRNVTIGPSLSFAARFGEHA